MLREFDRRVGFALDLLEWICARETIQDVIGVRIGWHGGVTERPIEYAAARNNSAPPAEVHASLEPVEALPFDKIEAELAESETGSIVADPATDDRIQVGSIGIT